jgi:hypothetical protein
MIDPARVDVKWTGPDFPEQVRPDVRREPWYTSAGSGQSCGGPPEPVNTHPPVTVPQPIRWDSIEPYVVGLGVVVVLAAMVWL